MSTSYQTALISALEWHIDSGVTDILEDAPLDRTQLMTSAPLPTALANQNNMAGAQTSATGEKASLADLRPSAAAPNTPHAAATDMQAPNGAQEAKQKALDLVKNVKTLDDLKQAIADFDGLGIKKTATNMVFSDGNPEASVMLIGEAPGADEDRLGQPFVGESGLLLDKMMAWIDLNRSSDDPKNSLYISNILNWRPPGNRTPTDSEIDISLPFIEKHIALVKPSLLIFAGGVAAKALLDDGQSISKLRGSWHSYKPRHDLGTTDTQTAIPAIATYHPAYLLRTPVQKKSVWQDLLDLKTKLAEL